MAFWSNNTSEAKRNYRFKVTINAFGADNFVWWAKTATLPSFDVSEIEHNYMDNKYYFPGRVSWTEVTVSLVDQLGMLMALQTNHKPLCYSMALWPQRLHPYSNQL